jgi:hypothetical protein
MVRLAPAHWSCGVVSWLRTAGTMDLQTVELQVVEVGDLETKDAVR